MLKAENQELVRAFLEKHDEFVSEPFELGKIKADEGMYCFWPHIDESDGFFAAKLKRIK